MKSNDNFFLEHIKTHGDVRPVDLARDLKISKAALHQHLKRLIEKGLIEKIGSTPKVVYRYKVKTLPDIPKVLSAETEKIINDNYLYISPSGEMLAGITGFWEWVVKIKQEKQFEFLAREYVKTRREADKFINTNGLINATEKLKNTFDRVFLDKVYYADFYSLPKYGKTKLGQMVLYAKQSQNNYLMTKIWDQTKDRVLDIIERNKIEAVGFIPPTVPRKIQFLEEYARLLALSLPEIPLTKIAREVIVPQKTLSTLSERVSNIQETLIVRLTGKIYKNILLIDDAVGSGATFNETAKKLRASKSVTGKIIAFAVVGSYKGFDVIREV
ncbi:MarR family transcriptional regulator [Candidatus Gottesmanbacteria bacterium]|nr:MarR family transcriptional regulator [Candidatus Gottesmanbacteria bacterium]